MQCPRCQHENRPARRFCSECGAFLALACPSCGFSNEPGEKFCGGCGVSLEPAATAHAPAIEERRWVTVVFADLAGFTALSEALDPEDVNPNLKISQAARA